MRKDTSSTLLTLSAAAILMMLLASPLLLSNPLLLQPVQAQTLMTFRTLEPALGSNPAGGGDLSLTFDVHGTTSSPDPSSVDITNGTIQLQEDPENNGTILSGEDIEGTFTNDSQNGPAIEFSTTIDNSDYSVSSPCSTSDDNSISLTLGIENTVPFDGKVECSTGGGNTASSSPSQMTETSTTPTKDSDGDGLPDSSDRCTHNSNPRCFKEGGDVCTTAQLEQPSSSNRNGNQTR